MIKIANAPCSWGVLEFDLEGQTAGYAQVLDEMRDTGYAGTELGDWGFMPTDAVQLKHELEARGLTMLAAFVPVNLSDRAAHGAGEEAAIRTAHLLANVVGADAYIVLSDDNGHNPIRTHNAGRIRPEQGLSADGWQIFSEGANRVARAVHAQTGLRTVFHHHCAGYVETPQEIEQFLTLTDPGVLGLCFDTGHYRFGGGDPLAGLRQHADRIWHVHFKDCHPDVARRSRAQGWDYFKSVREGLFCELGQGDVPFAEVKSILDQLGYDGWIVVEQDVLPGMGQPKESAQRNRDFLKRIGL